MSFGQFFTQKTTLPFLSNVKVGGGDPHGFLPSLHHHEKPSQAANLNGWIINIKSNGTQPHPLFFLSQAHPTQPLPCTVSNGACGRLQSKWLFADILALLPSFSASFSITLLRIPSFFFGLLQLHGEKKKDGGRGFVEAKKNTICIVFFRTVCFCVCFLSLSLPLSWRLY